MNKKIIIGIIIVLILGLIVYFTISSIDSLEVVEMKRQNLEYSFLEDGVVTAKNKEYVYPKTSGNIKEILVKSNQLVEAGTVLMTLDNEDAENSKQVIGNKYASLLNQVKIQESAISSAKTNLDSAEDAFNNAFLLMEHGGISSNEFENIKRARNKAIDALDAANKTLAYYNSLAKEAKTERDIANSKLGKYAIKSSIKGLVAYHNLEQGMLVSPTQKVMTIYDTDTKEVEAYVRTEYASLLSVGDKVNIKIKKATGNTEYTGIILEIGQTAEERTSSLGLKEYMVKVIIDFDDQSIDIGMEFDVEVEFFMKPIENVLAVSKASIFSAGNEKFVWELKDGKLNKIKIEEKTKTHDMVEVEGLIEGMLIVKDASNEKIDIQKKYNSKLIDLN